MMPDPDIREPEARENWFLNLFRRKANRKTIKRAGEWDSEDREARYDGDGGLKGTRR